MALGYLEVLIGQLQVSGNKPSNTMLRPHGRLVPNLCAAWCPGCVISLWSSEWRFKAGAEELGHRAEGVVKVLPTAANTLMWPNSGLIYIRTFGIRMLELQNGENNFVRALIEHMQ